MKSEALESKKPEMHMLTLYPSQQELLKGIFMNINYDGDYLEIKIL